MKTKLEALVFDVDGTLADTERDGHRVAFNTAFDEYGVDWHWDIETYRQLLTVTGGKERMHYYASEFLPDKNPPENFDRLVPELHAAKTRHYTELLSTGAIPLRPGIERLLNEAREKNFRLAIATTTMPGNVTTLLSHTLGEESPGWFEIIAAGDIVPAKKPAGDIYNYVLKQMSLSPQQCLAFEDSHNGILSSIEAGLKTLVTVNDYTRDHDFTGAALVLDNLGEPDRPFNILRDHADNYFNSHRFVDCDFLVNLHSRT